MIPQANVSRKPIVIAVVAFSALLVGVSALLPSTRERQVEAKRQSLVGLTRTAAPKLSVKPAILMPWPAGRGDAPGRDFTVHAYFRLGTITVRRDLMAEGWIGGSKGRGRTVFHLFFDPNRPDDLRIATAIAASTDRGMSGLRQEALVAGRTLKSKILRDRVLQVEKTVGKPALALARSRLLTELADGGATAYPPGTVLYEVSGRFYRAPKMKTLTTVTSFSAYSPEFAEAVEALADARVSLP